MQCCPLSGGDGDGPSVCNTRIASARKPYTCCECSDPIPVGARYEYVSGLWDGSWDTYRTCLTCAELRDHFACGNGYVFEHLWEDLEQNFFPGMTAGGPCMEGLSPVAKGRMFDRCLAWLESPREYELRLAEAKRRARVPPLNDLDRMLASRRGERVAWFDPPQTINRFPEDD